MRLPLTNTGVPFTGTRVILDQRTVNNDDTTRFVTLLARNTSLDTPGTVQVTLIDADNEEDALPIIDLPTFTRSRKESVVLERFAVRGPVALRIEPSDDVLIYGYVEITPIEKSGVPDPFYLPDDTRDQRTALTYRSRGVNADGDPPSAERAVHQLNGSLEEVSLVIDTPSDSASLELRFYEDDDTFSALRLEGRFTSFQVFERIPMRSNGSIRVQALAGPFVVTPLGPLFNGQTQAFAGYGVYGTTIRR